MEIIQDSRNEKKILPILKGSILRLNKAGADFIVIPCNTVHIFIEDLRLASSVPIISIVDETVKFVKNKNYTKVGLLATKKTIDSGLYESPMKENGIDVIIPTRKEQNEISEIIIKILRNNVKESDKLLLKKIIEHLAQRGSEAIILGCTDLQLILKQKFSVELLDTMEILVQSAFEKL